VLQSLHRLSQRDLALKRLMFNHPQLIALTASHIKSINRLLLTMFFFVGEYQ